MAASTSDQRKAIEIALAEERERRRIARGLHDEVGRLLAEAGRELERLEPDGPVAHIRDLVGRALAATRSFTFDLALPPIGEHGLGGLLETVCRQADARDDLEVFFEEHGKSCELSDGVILVLGQVLRELLYNVVKHAGASTTSVLLEYQLNAVKISVTDDGIGLTGRIDGSGFGLADCRGRLADLGGYFEFGSKDGVGTRIVMRLPLE